MPIEFRCVTCQKLLRVSDDAYGKKARCPDCGTIQEPRDGAGEQPGNSTTAPYIPSSSLPPAANNPFAEPGSPASPLTQPASLNPYAAAAASDSFRDAILAKVQVPAAAMLIVAGFSIVSQLVVLGGMSFVAIVNNGRIDGLVFNLIAVAFSLTIAFIIAAGAMKMRELQNYGLAMTAALLSMLPCSTCCMITLPIGIWSLVVLLDPTVRNAFR